MLTPEFSEPGISTVYLDSKNRDYLNVEIILNLPLYGRTQVINQIKKVEISCQVQIGIIYKSTDLFIFRFFLRTFILFRRLQLEKIFVKSCIRRESLGLVKGS